MNENAAMILRQCSVFSPRTELCHYLNVVPRNVVRVFPPDTPLPSDRALSQVMGSQASERG